MLAIARAIVYYLFCHGYIRRRSRVNGPTYRQDRPPQRLAEVKGFEPLRRFHALSVFKTELFSLMSTPPNTILLFQHSL